MAVKLSYAGAWRDVADGTLRIRYAGNWHFANKVYIRYAGVWHDTGYTGFSGGPSIPWVAAWDYSNVIFAWNPPDAGGAPVDHYHVYIEKLGYGAIVDVNTAATSYFVPIEWDSQYRFYVSAVSTSGLETGWSTPDGYGIGIGHPQQDTYGDVLHSQPWQSQVQFAYRCRDELFGVYVTNDIHLSSLTWNNLRTSIGGVVSIATNRSVNYYLNNTWGGPINDDLPGGRGTQIISSSSYSSWTIPLDNFGNNAYWGIAPQGTSWTPGSSATIDPNGKMLLYADAVYFSGEQYYYVNEVVSSVPAQGNYYL